MKTLVVVAHPNLEESQVNARWLTELAKFPEEFTIHSLYEEDNFDILKEQELIKRHDKLILQFPIYWFNCPPAMKKWLDDVFVKGWAYGEGNQIKKHNVSLVVSAGIKEKNYAENGRYKHTLKEILLPFEVAFNYMEADYNGFYALYGAEYGLTSEDIEESIPAMLEFARK
ncbi:MAG: NAD(P)H-dependent oxidoreductase [Enterococcus avium]